MCYLYEYRARSNEYINLDRSLPTKGSIKDNNEVIVYAVIVRGKHFPLNLLPTCKVACLFKVFFSFCELIG